MSSTLLEVSELNAWYGPAHVLFDVAIQLGKGEIVGVLGRNGAGKTTFLRSIMGLDVRRTGRISLEGLPLERMRPYAIARRGIAWVPDDRRIYPNLTAEENIRLGGACARAEGTASIAELVDVFPLLGRLLKRRGGALSGGELQVVAVARGLYPRPIALLLDEPTEGLAPLVVEQLCEAILRIPRDFGASVLIAEQNLPVAFRVCDRVVVFETGRLTYRGRASELKEDRESQERYLGVGAKVEVDAERG